MKHAVSEVLNFSALFLQNFCKTQCLRPAKKDDKDSLDTSRLPSGQPQKKMVKGGYWDSLY